MIFCKKNIFSRQKCETKDHNVLNEFVFENVHDAHAKLILTYFCVYLQAARITPRGNTGVWRDGNAYAGYF